jgi:hypothetical protein
MNSMFLDLDASPIAGQTGWAILDLQGQILKQSSSSAIMLTKNDVDILFRMFSLLPPTTTTHNKKEEEMVDSTLAEKGDYAIDHDTKDDGGWERMTVTWPGSARFIVTRDEAHVYMVQTRGV